MVTRRTFALGLASATALPLLRPARARAASPIRIGVIQPMSGAYSAYAQEGQPAFNYIIDRINASGGVKRLGGTKIEVVLADDASQPARAAAEARRLASEEGCVMLSGSILSSEMLAMAPVLDELEIPTLSFWAGGSRSNQFYSLGFPYDRGYAQSMCDFVVWLRDKKGYALHTVVPTYSNYEAGQQTNKFLVEKLKAAGFEILGDAPLDTKAQDQTAAMIRIRAMKPDLVMGLVTPRDGLLLHQARYNLSYHDSVFVGGTGGYSDFSLWRDLGPQVSKSTLTRNLFAMTGFSPGARMASMQAIVQELRAVKTIPTIGQGAIQGAQAARVLQRALEGANGPDRIALRESLAKTTIPPGDPDLYLAKPRGLAFGDDRLLSDGSAMFVQWLEDQTQEVVYPTQFAQNEPRPRG